MHNPNDSQFWDAAYREAKDHWDMGTPTPVFVNLFSSHSDERRKYLDGLFAIEKPSVIVPGCGRGYDAMLLAEHGFDVTAVDFSIEATEYLQHESLARGLDLTVIRDDVLAIDERHDAKYDALLEYTCFCALDPVRRVEYYRFVERVLRKGGFFIGLMFPIDGRPGGPPFNVQLDEFRGAMSEAFEPLHEEQPDDSVSPRGGKETLMIWRRKVNADS